MNTAHPVVSCPHCHQKGTWRADNPFRPFCSSRCRYLDLGAWAQETRRLAGEPSDFTEVDLS